MLQGQIPDNFFVVIDEGDKLLLDHSEQLVNKHIVALSATIANTDYERKYLESKQMNFTIMSSKLPGFLHANMQLEQVTVADFMAKTEEFAKLVFCQEPEKFSEEKTAIDCRNLTRLQNLSASDTFVITDIDLTRGIDYRAAAGTKGIALLVMSPMPSERDFIQLLGRVGRFFEECKRMRWNELSELVSAQKVAGLNLKLATKRAGKLHNQVAGQTSLTFKPKTNN